MALLFHQLSIDARDHATLARWWADVLDWRIGYEDEYECNVVPPEHTDDPIDDLTTWQAQRPSLVFAPVPEGKTVKNRLHLDLAPHIDQDRDALLADLLAKGATLADVGQDPDVTWTVLADPEGNEFCLLSSRDR